MPSQSVVSGIVSFVAVASTWAGIAHGQAAEPEAAPSVSAPTSEAPVAQAASSAPAPSTASPFDRGMAALGAGDNKAAVELFTEAYAADGNVSALLNLGIAHTNLGQLTSAVDALTRYVQFADPARDAQTIVAVHAELARLRSENGVVGLQITPPEAALQVDGQATTPIDGEIIVAPGKRRFVVVADGYVTYDQTLDVAPGRFTLDVVLILLSQAPVALPEPTPATAPDAHAEDADNPEETPEAESHCALKSVCFGPVLSLIGPPNLFGGGLHFRLGEYFGAGLDYQMTPSITFDPVSISTSLFSVNARIYPFGGAFFLGGGFGYQSVHGRFANEDVTVGGTASFPAAMASIGFMGTSGFVMGLDLGVLFPVGSSKVNIDEMAVHREINGQMIPQEEIDNARGTVARQVSKVVDLLPVSVQLNLLRIGYLF